MSKEIKPCPCGETPTMITPIGPMPSKWMYANPDCCGMWEIEFRSQYLLMGDELNELAREAWNDAPRGTNTPQTTGSRGQNE